MGAEGWTLVVVSALGVTLGFLVIALVFGVRVRHDAGAGSRHDAGAPPGSWSQQVWLCGCEDFYAGSGRVTLSLTKPTAGECHEMGDCGWVRVAVTPLTIEDSR